MSNRSSLWQTIWAKKYETYAAHKDLHVAAGYDMLSYSQWQTLTHYFIQRLNLKASSRVLEVGCGCGAFLAEVAPRVKNVAGIDYSEPGITKLRNVLQGDFQVADASSLPYPDDTFNTVLSFGVFFYFEDFEYALKSLDEMRRVLLPNGQIFIGEVSDQSKRAIADKVRGADVDERNDRRVSKVEVDHLYYDQSFFVDYAKKHGMGCVVIEENVEELNFYPNSAYRFSVVLTAATED